MVRIMQLHSSFAVQTFQNFKKSPIIPNFKMAIKTTQEALLVIQQDARDRIQTFRDHVKERMPIVLRQRIMRSLWNFSPKKLEQIERTADSIIAAVPPDSSHKIKRKEITAADGYRLDGVSITHPDYKSTTVYFTGVTELWQTKLDTLWQLHKAFKTNIVCYNYRGTTQASLIDPQEDVLIGDGVTIMQKVISEHAAGHDTRIFGKSLGGAVGIIVGAKLAKMGIIVDVISERSFRSLAKAVRHVAGKLLASLTDGLKLQLDAEKALVDLRGRLIVIYHENDRVIPSPVSLKAALDEQMPKSLSSLHIIKLESDVLPRALFEAHCRPFTPEEIQKIAAVFH